MGLDRMGFAYGEPRGGLFVWADCSSTGIHADRALLPAAEGGARLDLSGDGIRRPSGANIVRITMLEPIDTLKEAVERMLPVLERVQSTGSKSNL